MTYLAWIPHHDVYRHYVLGWIMSPGQIPHPHALLMEWA